MSPKRSSSSTTSITCPGGRSSFRELRTRYARDACPPSGSSSTESRTGPFHSTTRRRTTRRTCSLDEARPMTDRVVELLRALGARIVNNWIWRLGFACRFLWLTLRESGSSFTRFHLTFREIYFAGVLSLVIILVSGLFVGMVLGLQGYDTLVRYGSSEALGVLVSLSLVRELGPVVARSEERRVGKGGAAARPRACP